VGRPFHLTLPLEGTGTSVLAYYEDIDLYASLPVWVTYLPDWNAIEVIDVGGTVKGTGSRARGTFSAIAIVSRPDGLDLNETDTGLVRLHNQYGVHEHTAPPVAKSFLSSAQFELDGEIAALPDGSVTGCQVETSTLYDARFVGASLQTCWVAVKISRVTLTNRVTRQVLRAWDAKDAAIINFRDKPEAVVHLPNSQAVEAAYPVRAVRAGMAGDVALRCEMDQAGRMGVCHVLSETPEGYGFGAAALRLAERMRSEPKSVSGSPLYSVVEFTIPFRRPIAEVFTEGGGEVPTSGRAGPADSGKLAQ
jgi:TonB family protein